MSTGCKMCTYWLCQNFESAFFNKIYVCMLPYWRCYKNQVPTWRMEITMHIQHFTMEQLNIISKNTYHQQMLKQTPKTVIIFGTMVLVSCLLIYYPFNTLPFSGGSMSPSTTGSTQHPANSVSIYLNQHHICSYVVYFYGFLMIWFIPC